MNNTYETTQLREYLDTKPQTVNSGYAISKKFHVATSTAYAVLKEYGYVKNSMTGRWELLTTASKEVKLTLLEAVSQLQKIIDSKLQTYQELVYIEEALKELLEHVEDLKMGETADGFD